MEEIRVLVVDDDPEVGDLTATFLERADARFVADSVTDAEEGLERLRIVEQIASVHGWDVRVTDGTDGGARFEFTGVAFERVTE